MKYDVAIVGGGHAGYEAAAASARLGCKTILLTMEPAKIGSLSCNPAIGGTAKGHLVKEIDALGGIMGMATDQTGIQFRILNRSRGPAVWSPRAQVDRHGYPKTIQSILRSYSNLEIRAANICGIQITNNRIQALVDQSGERIQCLAAVLTCGTFLNGIIHIGLTSTPAGRFDESPALGITEALTAFGFESGRLKTGTPPRIDKLSICFDGLEAQFGDVHPEPFSWSTDRISNRQVPCHVTYTSPATHEILKSGFDSSPMFTGRIQGVGPRYCPSIEDKINRFADKERHQIFLEPEGYESPEYYVNGFSTSLPANIQEEALRSIPGLQAVKMLRPGYAVEYDFFPPYQINKNMETKGIAGLFLAGQINGTSGYEEAGAQGLMAGTNAALLVKGRDSFVLERNEAYIGVMIDDLVNKSTLEPYRIFTSLAEHRLLLRSDNADLRLTKKAYEIGLVSHAQFARTVEKADSSRNCQERIGQTNIKPEHINEYLRQRGSSVLTEPVSVATLLKRPNIHLSDILKIAPDLLYGTVAPDQPLRPDVLREVDTSVKYEGYIAKQREMVDRFLRMEKKRIPANFDYDSIRSLSKEGKEKLAKIQPQSIGQASRVSGVTPADISILLVYLEKRNSIV